MRSNIKITFYDLVDLNYASFYLAGFHGHGSQGAWAFSVSKRLPAMLKDLLDDRQWKDILFSVLLFKYSLDDDEFFFCIDTRDSSSTTGTGKGYHLPLLQKVRYYFKVNYRKETIEGDVNLAHHARKIVPISPFFPTKLPSAWSYLPSPYSSINDGWAFRGAVRRLRQIRELPSMDKLRVLRRRPKIRDVFFVVGYYDGHEQDNEFRYQIMDELRRRPHISSSLGFVGRNLPGKYRELQIDREIPLYAYLSEVAASRVAVYVRGVHDCLSFKFGQLLAMGMPMVGQPILNNRENLMVNPHFDTQFAYEAPLEIVERIEQLLARPEELERIGYSNASVFDAKYTPEKVVSELLDYIAA